jgi:hypothetical protein
LPETPLRRGTALAIYFLTNRAAPCSDEPVPTHHVNSGLDTREFQLLSALPARRDLISQRSTPLLRDLLRSDSRNVGEEISDTCAPFNAESSANECGGKIPRGIGQFMKTD